MASWVSPIYNMRRGGLGWIKGCAASGMKGGGPSEEVGISVFSDMPDSLSGRLFGEDVPDDDAGDRSQQKTKDQDIANRAEFDAPARP